MKHLRNIVLASVLGLSLPSYATIIVDDTWADGSRAEQNLPTESQWFAGNRASNFVTTVGSMSFHGNATGSRAGLTYFAPNGSPVSLASVGDMIRATLVFTPYGMGAANTSQNIRFGMFDFSGGTRLAADGTSSSLSGANVLGYGMFLHFTPTFGSTTPITILDRDVNTTSSDLLGTSTTYTSLGAGGGVAVSDPGFVEGTEYTLTLDILRTGPGVDITATITGTGLSLSHTVSDASGQFNFDTFAFRSSNTSATAAELRFTEFKIETNPVPEPTAIALFGVAAMGMIGCYRRFRS